MLQGVLFLGVSIGVSVEILLEIMKVRYEMQRNGITSPSQHIKNVTKLMVGKRLELDNSREIDTRVLTQESFKSSQYVRSLNCDLQK